MEKRARIDEVDTPPQFAVASAATLDAVTRPLGLPVAMFDKAAADGPSKIAQLDDDIMRRLSSVVRERQLLRAVIVSLDAGSEALGG